MTLTPFNLSQCSHDENFASLNRKDDGTTAIVLENPKTSEYQVVRTSLLPGILKTIRENRKHALPLRTFEVSDVAFKDPTETERCARNERRVAAVYCDKAAAFEVVHGLLDKLMLALGYPRIDRADKSKRKGYYIAEAESESYIMPAPALAQSLRSCFVHSPVSFRVRPNLLPRPCSYDSPPSCRIWRTREDAVRRWAFWPTSARCRRNVKRVRKRLFARSRLSI